MPGQLSGLGKFPSIGDKFVLLVLEPSGQLQVRAQLPDGGDHRAVVAFLRNCIEDIERDTLGVHLLKPGPTPSGGV